MNHTNFDVAAMMTVSKYTNNKNTETPSASTTTTKIMTDDDPPQRQTIDNNGSLSSTTDHPSNSETTDTAITKPSSSSTPPPQPSRDDESIRLLREIFPELSTPELESLHENRIETLSAKTKSVDENDVDDDDDNEEDNPPPPKPPPTSTTNQPSSTTNPPTSPPLTTMLQTILTLHSHHEPHLPLSSPYILSPSLRRRGSIGLGLTIRECDGCLYVHALVDANGRRWYAVDNSVKAKEEEKGPAHKAGVRPGDRILGVNGGAFLRWRVGVARRKGDGDVSEGSSRGREREREGSMKLSVEILKKAVEVIMNTQDPVVLHLWRGGGGNREEMVRRREEMGGGVDRGGFIDDGSVPIHPLARALRSKGLLQSINDEKIVTMQLAQFTERTAQWEAATFLRIDARTFELYPLNDETNNDSCDTDSNTSTTPTTTTTTTNPLHPSSTTTPSTPLPAPRRKSVVLDSYPLSFPYNPSTTTSHTTTFPRRRTSTSTPSPSSYPALPPSNISYSKDILIPLLNIRKGLSIRIVNTFLDGDNRLAYTIWVYDIESNKEWYAPVRYFSHFKDLRNATSRLHPSVKHIAFPRSMAGDGWMKGVLMGGVWSSAEENGGEETEEEKKGGCGLLERFLRSLSGLIYTGTLHPYMAEMAIHLQSFLGCDERKDEKESFDEEGRAVECLKRAIRLFTNRLFILPLFEQLVRQFIASIKTSSPTIEQMIALDRRSKLLVKESAKVDLENVRDFLDQIQELISEGCMEDLMSLALRKCYAMAVGVVMEGRKEGSAEGEDKLRLFIEGCVREQIEIEIYVPLRSVISRQLVNGWMHDDLEMQFKMQELRKRPQSHFKIPPNHQSPTKWYSASRLLSDGVGRSTLPCQKLRAIVDSAKEIVRLNKEERQRQRQRQRRGSEEKEELGADDFLPIFIYCVVQAELERPCALSVLLRTLCEPSKRIGETGYYLASFEAAVAHIRQLDLAAKDGNSERRKDDERQDDIDDDDDDDRGRRREVTVVVDNSRRRSSNSSISSGKNPRAR